MTEKKVVKAKAVKPVVTLPTIKRITMSMEAECSEARFCFPIGGTPKLRAAWIENHDLFVCEGRAYALVDTFDRVFFMDAITGQLYNFGTCMSSDRLFIHGIVRNHGKASVILNNTRKEL